MLKYIKHQFSKLIDVMYAISNRESMESQFRVIQNKILSVQSRQQLFEARRLILQYRDDIDDLGNPSWGTTNTKVLASLWAKKYRAWKERG